MKLREMTNEELADLISDGCGTSMMGLATREAAARLRRLSAIKKAAKIAGETSESFSRDNAVLRSKLKIAEDALEESLNYSNSEELRKAQHNAKKALAIIREKGNAHDA